MACVYLQRPRNIDNWEGVLIFIYSCLQTEKQSISKEMNDAEHEHMNISS